ncbi:WD40 repeat domain-containing protein [Oceanospirillum linum]|uniref:Uncharacterized protein n=1 Tax=Oceanospirillum linum TaxID=966 RepID=A0A1T1HGG0_OCELI|nr:hypothetical protein [Oceanospirillum linum]OOV88830.1 hypothetical protein BTA35_0205005 [Oceanospirillum linum]SEG49407.1 hypothetical protein SAMN04489856_11315 [Oleiphilus messinensis]SMP22740.1 WD-40 repeat-containing protein [Oceanospirillum linum]
MIHTGKTVAAAVVTLFMLAVSGCSDLTPPEQTWSLATKGHYDAALSDNGSLAVAASIHHGGSLWQLPQHERVFNWNHKADTFSLLDHVAIAGNGRYGATSEQKKLTLWDATSGKAINFWALPADVRSLDISADGQFLLAGLDNSTAVLISTSQGKGVRTFTTDDTISAVRLSDDNSLAMAGTRTGVVYLWNTENGEIRGQWSHDNQVRSMAISPDNRFAFSGAQAGSGLVVDLISGKIAMNIDINRGGEIAAATYTAATFSQNQSLLATGTSTGKLKLWDLSSQQAIAGWEASKRNAWKPSGVVIQDIAFVSNSSIRAIASNGLAYQFAR